MKNQHIKNISVGIPAYNEEANIRYLIESLLAQKEADFLLKEIIVISDGSSDKTVSTALSVNDKRVVVVDRKDRKGQAFRQNEILKIFKGDILVLLNADILPKDDLFLVHIIAPFEIQEKIGIVSGRGIPLPAETFFEKIINFSTSMKEEMAEKINDGNNIYLCHGHSRAFSRAFVQHFSWVGAVSEDAYSYLMCKKSGFSFFYAKDAEILYRSPQNFKDHMRQSIRFFKGQNDLGHYVSRDIVILEHKIPHNILIKTTMKYFLKNPVLFVGYITVLLMSKILSLSKKKLSVNWDVATSSKSLIK